MPPLAKPHNAFRRITVPAIGDGYRLDALCAAYLSLDAEPAVHDAITHGLVLEPDGTPCSGVRSVHTGDVFQLDLTILARSLTAPPCVSVLYEDDDLLIVNKPANQLVHPAGGSFDWTVIDAIRLRHPRADIDLCHRLDKQTSGVLVLTKNKTTNALVKNEFESRRVRKEYRAIALGTPAQKRFTCTQPIGHARDDSRVRRKVTSTGQSAQTDFIIRDTARGLADIACFPITGRSHQIRVHLAYLGLPIVGDRLYETDGQPTSQSPALAAVHSERHALHCHSIEFTYRGSPLATHSAGLPSDMQSTWEAFTPDAD